MRKGISGILFLILSACLFVQCSKNYDLVIKGGTIYDGNGGSPYRADIGVKDGIIVKIGNIAPGVSEVIDASGLCISPGFIDIHTHCDGGLKKPELSAVLNYITQGVTTVVTGNCGFGTYHVDDFYNYLDSIGIGPNVVHLVGHNTLRKTVMGQEDRAPTGEELRQMKMMLDTGMQGGAAGFSTGLYYAPGSYAETEEIIALGEPVKEYGGIYSTHIRDESNLTTGLIPSIKEAIEVGETLGIPVQISHIKTLGRPPLVPASEVCSVIEAARERGLSVMADQYPYHASSSSIAGSLIPRWIQAGGEMKSRLQDPSLLPRIKEEIARNIDHRGGPGTIFITSFPENREFDGKNLAEIAHILDKTVPETVIYLIMIRNPGVVSFSMDEKDVEYFMKKEWVMTCSDGWIFRPGDGKPHPRSYGSFTRKIRKYVLEDHVISMEQAIRAATALPAGMLGLNDRGLIEQDLVADLVIFDPDRIRDKATFEEPHQYSEGIDYLLVNGEVVIENGKFNGTLAGKPLRMNRY